MAFPTLNRRGTHVGNTSNTTTYSPTPTWTFANNIPDGQTTRWYLIVTGDGVPTLSVNTGASDAGWQKLVQGDGSASAVTQAIFWIETTSEFLAVANPSISLTSSASEQYSAVWLAFTAAAGKSLGHLLSSVAQGSSTNSNPPAITNNTGASQDVSVVATRGGDSTVVPSAAPTNYSNLNNRAGGGTNGASTSSAERNITIANSGTEDPGVFTVATEQWVSYTFGVYEFAAPAAVGLSYGLIF